MITTSEFCKAEYGTKLYKLSFDGGFTCPNRDGTKGTGGCIFCSTGGSGDFAVKLCRDEEGNIINLKEAIAAAKEKVSKKFSGDKYIAYFQAFSNTYASCDILRKTYMPIIERPEIEVLDIATRPDCLNDEIYNLLGELNKIKSVWVELGLQTVKESSVEYINRGYDTKEYDEAVMRLNNLGIHTITHVILYLPDESLEDMKRTVRHVAQIGSKGIKLSLLHVLKNTRLADDYEKKHFYIPKLDEYAETVGKLISLLPEETVVHRITGDPPKKLLIEPQWAADKKRVLNTLNAKIGKAQPYYVYMLRCKDGSIYTGSTNDVEKRVKLHKMGKGCKYTRSHLPVELVYFEELSSKSDALKREYAIKQLSHSEKERLIGEAPI